MLQGFVCVVYDFGMGCFQQLVVPCCHMRIAVCLAFVFMQKAEQLLWGFAVSAQIREREEIITCSLPVTCHYIT
jgi:hypothetical protein